MFRFERQWGKIAQKLRARANRAHPEASLIRIVRLQWRFVDHAFIDELNDRDVVYPLRLGKRDRMRLPVRVTGCRCTTLC